MALTHRDLKNIVSSQKIRPHSHKNPKHINKPDEDFRQIRSSTFVTQDGVGPVTPLSGRSLISLGHSFSISPRDWTSEFSNAHLLFRTSRSTCRVDHSIDLASSFRHQVYGDTSEVGKFINNF